ncbi:MAG TPA: lytic transglycosylase domain-containing protein [Pyrinomonadaceae bacterium]|nr:lytic transglycosylase domain-containing protein [Pyrinomonadaceae bacterium]
MRKFLPLVALVSVFFAAHVASAQTGARYHFDNFDTQQGVRVVTPAPQPKAASPKKVRLTARSLTPTPPAADIVAEARPRIAAMAVGKSLDGFSTGDAMVDSLIVDSGTRHGVDPVLLYAIMHRESSFKRRAISYKGARGLMQLMPATAARFGVRDIFDPRQNIEGGTRYMRFLLDFFGGDVRLALAGYNAGEGAVLKYGRRIPPYNETQEYVKRIWQRYTMMRDPQTARFAPTVTRRQVAAIAAKEKPAALVYEQHVYAVRMPDGKLRLVSQ